MTDEQRRIIDELRTSIQGQQQVITSLQSQLDKQYGLLDSLAASFGIEVETVPSTPTSVPSSLTFTVKTPSYALIGLPLHVKLIFSDSADLSMSESSADTLPHALILQSLRMSASPSVKFPDLKEAKIINDCLDLIVTLKKRTKLTFKLGKHKQTVTVEPLPPLPFSTEPRFSFFGLGASPLEGRRSASFGGSSVGSALSFMPLHRSWRGKLHFHVQKCSGVAALGVCAPDYPVPGLDWTRHWVCWADGDAEHSGTRKGEFTFESGSRVTLRIDMPAHSMWVQVEGQKEHIVFRNLPEVALPMVLGRSSVVEFSRAADL